MSKWTVVIGSVADKAELYKKLASEDQASLNEFQNTISSLATVWEGEAAAAAITQFNGWLTTAGNLNARLFAAGKCLEAVANRYSAVHEQVKRRFNR